MKIALVANTAFPIREPFAGGLEKMTFLLGLSLLDKGHKVDFYGHPDSDAWLNVQSVPSFTEAKAELYNRMSQKEGTDVDRIREQLGYIQIMTKISKKNYDLVHNHSQHYIPIVMGNLFNVPILTSVHTPPLERLQYGALGIRENPRMSFTMVSKSLSDAWKEWIPRTEVVHNGIAMEKWPFVKNPTGNYLCWYGRICKEKGTRLAIEAAKSASIPIKLAGPVYDRNYFDQYIEPLIDNRNTFYLGHLNQFEIAPLVGNARATLFTSLWQEPFGLTLIESLACGTPLVAFEGGAVSEIRPFDEQRHTAKALQKAKWGIDYSRYRSSKPAVEAFEQMDFGPLPDFGLERFKSFCSQIKSFDFQLDWFYRESSLLKITI